MAFLSLDNPYNTPATKWPNIFDAAFVAHLVSEGFTYDAGFAMYNEVRTYATNAIRIRADIDGFSYEATNIATSDQVLYGTHQWTSTSSAMEQYNIMVMAVLPYKI